MRHHADKFILDGTPDGFPPHYLDARDHKGDSA
jgi:hypothetical protein